MKQIEIKYIIISTITLNVNGLYCKALCKQTSLMIKIAANFIECLSHVRHSANPFVLYLVYSLQWPPYNGLGIICINISCMWKLRLSIVTVHCYIALRGRASIQTQDVWLLNLHHLVILNVILIMDADD